jgi:hypothetical protein
MYVFFHIICTPLPLSTYFVSFVWISNSECFVAQTVNHMMLVNKAINIHVGMRI